jgi:hypothetical protein
MEVLVLYVDIYGEECPATVKEMTDGVVLLPEVENAQGWAVGRWQVNSLGTQ